MPCVGSDQGITCTLQRKNTEISKQIFPEKEYRDLSPNFHIHASVSDLLYSHHRSPILLEEICRPNLGLYKSLTDTWMLKLGLRPRCSRKGIHKGDFRCSIALTLMGNVIRCGRWIPFRIYSVPLTLVLSKQQWVTVECRFSFLSQGRIQQNRDWTLSRDKILENQLPT